MMVAAGSGIAPFRGFWGGSLPGKHERRIQQERFVLWLQRHEGKLVRMGQLGSRR